MRIGNLQVEGNLFLAPMSNVTSLPFRVLCRRYGASVVYSEMINADAFVMQSHKTVKRTYFIPEERPIGIQLSGSEKDVLREAVSKIESELKPDIIDINIGCPAYTVMRSGCGASLLSDPVKIGDIVKAMSEATSLPFTCKMRVLSDRQKSIIVARTIERAGAAALTVHGRTAKQKYTGKADWTIIKEIKAALKIPVILNGDIVDEDSAKKALDLTAVDGLMIGRASIGNPYLFRRVSHYLLTGKRLPDQSYEDRIEDFMAFLGMCKQYGYLNIASIKMHAQYFTKGEVGGRPIRDEIARCDTVDGILDAMRRLAGSGLEAVPNSNA